MHRLFLTAFTAALAWGLAVQPIAVAHDQVPGPPQNHPVVIQHATIHPVDRPVIENGSLLFEKGQITAVGKSVPVPDGAQVVDGDGKHVYPGLIESTTALGLREISAVDVTVDRRERGELNPNVRSWIAVNPDSELIPVTRAGGVLVANVAPSGGWIRGQGAVMNLDGWTAEDMVLRAPSGLWVDWQAMQPGGRDDEARARKREKKLRELDDLLDRVRRYHAAREENPEQTPTNVRLESLMPVIDGQLPLFAEANRQGTIESAVAYAQSHDLKLVIYGGYDAADCAELLRRYDVPVIVGATYRLPRRRHDPYDAPYSLPERLRKAGVKYCIAGTGPGYPTGASNARNLPYHAGNAVAYGLPRDEAVRAITLSAAEILGVDEQIGSLTAGKEATLIIADGDVLETESNVTDAFIQGRRVDLGSKHKTLYHKYREKYRRQ